MRRRRSERRMTEGEARAENRAVWAMVVIVTLLIALALYGWYSGAWENAPN